MTTTQLTSLIVTSELRHRRSLGSVEGISAGAARDRKATRETTPLFSSPVVRELPFAPSGP
jgi:hypothetical protein